MDLTPDPHPDRIPHASDRKTLRPRMRLRSSASIRATFAAKKSCADEILIVFGIANDLGRPRLGISVPRKIGNAVQRNRWKRWIREAFREMRGTYSRSIDIVVVPRGGSGIGFQDVLRSMKQLAPRVSKKLGAYKERDNRS